jgi:hypothetical protein
VAKTFFWVCFLGRQRQRHTAQGRERVQRTHTTIQRSTPGQTSQEGYIHTIRLGERGQHLGERLRGRSTPIAILVSSHRLGVCR